ncbi:MAG: shikimate dehydrogenase, partial [Bacteroidota bacterium]
MKTYGLLGYPLKNSFSANYFNAKFRSPGTDAVYKNFPLTHIDELQQLLKEHPEMAGLNVTIPYKEAVIPLLHELSDTAEKVGAVNTIQFVNNKLIGHNTDVFGFERSLLPLLKPWHQNALVLGTGGASKAVVHVLGRLGITHTMVSRNGEAGMLYEEIDRAMIRSHQLVINCTPLGMFPDVDAFPPIPYEFFTDLHIAYDLIYLPEETKFLSFAKQHGAVTKKLAAVLGSRRF